jgi:tetratricopeptide (TPR) repeat protein
LKKRPIKSNPESQQKSPAPTGPNHHLPPTAVLSARRLWLFRLLALSLLPLLLVLLELGLRLAGYGYATGFFQPLQIGGENYLVQNEDFGLRFFPKETFRRPEPIRINAVKPPGRIRIFILGESAALGDPEPAYGAGRYLQALLRERFPAGDFEVVNVAFTAINSHVILPIARECAQQQGDVWIVYMGNNEMVGPFGAATVFGSQAPPLFVAKAVPNLQRTRVGQLLTAGMRRLGRSSAPASAWKGMEMFLENRVAPDSPRKERVYQNFQRNLDDILEAGLNAGGKVILSTMAVNLKDSPPFASMMNSNLPAGRRQEFEASFDRAKRLEGQGNFAAAAPGYEQALQHDPRFAEAQFRLGNCLLQLTNATGAAGPLQLACDYDALPFRADSRINAVIREAGRRFAARGLLLCDASAGLGTNTQVPALGRETFYEHVHFNFAGNYQLARTWADQVLGVLPATVTRSGAGEWASQATCERRLGLTDWNRVFVIESVIARLQQPPLNGQFNNSERLQLLRTELAELRQRANPNTATSAEEIYVAAIKQSPTDHLLYENFAKFLESTKNLKLAVAQWQRVTELLPNNYRAFYQAGRLAAELNQWAEAEAALVRAVALNPSMAQAWFELGHVLLRLGKAERALDAYERAARLEPANVAYCTLVGKALRALNRPAEAIAQYRKAVQLQPDSWLARFALGDALAADNQFTAAGQEFAEVIRLKPTNVPAHLNLGLVQARLGQRDAALRQFEEVLRLEPGNQAAREYRDRIRSETSGKP